MCAKKVLISDFLQCSSRNWKLLRNNCQNSEINKIELWNTRDTSFHLSYNLKILELVLKNLWSMHPVIDEYTNLWRKCTLHNWTWKTYKSKWQLLNKYNLASTIEKAFARVEHRFDTNDEKLDDYLAEWTTTWIYCLSINTSMHLYMFKKL